MINTRGMSNASQLARNEGQSNGKQLIPSNGVRKTTTTVTPKEIVNQRDGLDESSDFQTSYGYMWRILENMKGEPDFAGAYSATGFGGQFITVIPKRKIVMAHKTKLDLQTQLGWKKAGVPTWQYWEMIHKLIANQ